MDELHNTRLTDCRLLERPNTLGLELRSIANYHHDQLPVLPGHDLWLLHEGGRLSGGNQSGSRLGLDVQVELGLQLPKVVLHHALVVAAVVGARFLGTEIANI